MTSPPVWEPTEPDFRPGEMDDDEADALIEHYLSVVNTMRANAGLDPITLDDATEA